MTKPKPIILTEHSRALNQVRAILAICVLVLVVGIASLGYIFGGEIGQLERQVAQANAERAGFEQAFNEANQKVIQRGGVPVEPPPVAEPSQPGTPGEDGRDGRPPTAAGIRDAVASYCAADKCRGPAGQSVTPREVAAAVSAFCDARGECRGRTGPVGVNGRNGVDGTDGSQGPQGPPPSDAQVAAAVAAFCAGGKCVGAAGPPGPVGPQGPPGADGQPGPACPPGFTPQRRLVITDDGPEQATLCVAG